MKQSLLLATFTLLCLATLYAQVDIDKSINLSGTGSDAKITGIKDVSAPGDAVSAEALQSGKLTYATVVNGGSDISLAFVPCFTATSLTAGTVISFKATQANLTNVRLNVCSLGLINLLKDGAANLAAGDIQTGQIITAVYDGANFHLTSRGNTGVTSLTGTTNQVNVSAPTGSVTLSTPQDIHTGASPTFAGATLTGLTASANVYTDGAGKLTTAPPTSGQLGYWSRAGTLLSNVPLTDNVGIGTATPAYKLDVIGTAKVTNAYLNNTNTLLGQGSGNALRITTGTGWVEYGAQNASWAHFATDRPQYYFDKQVGFDGNAFPYTDNTRSLGTASNRWNNGFFTNLTLNGSTITSWPSGADNLGNHTATATLGLNNNWLTIKPSVTPDVGNIGIGWHGTDLSYAIYQEAGAWSAPYPDLRIGFHTGLKLGAHSSYGGTRIYNNSDMATQIASIGDGDNNTRIYYNLATVGDIVSNQNYGLGNVGLYASTRYQNVWAMGAAYRLTADGTAPGNLYGLAWTYPSVGGQSKAGLSHQLLLMENGSTKVALGTGIWTVGNLTFNDANPYISASSYFIAPGGAYFNSGVVYTEAAIRARGGILNDNGGYLQLYGYSGFTGTKVNNNAFYVDYNQSGGTGPAVAGNAGGMAVTGNWTAGQGEVNIWNNGPAGSNRGFKFWYYNGSGYTEIVRINQSGNNISNGWTTFSDVRFKKNITPVTGALSKIRQISAYRYEMKAEKFKHFPFDNNTHIGFIAQEVEKIIPEIVETDEDGLKSIEYGHLAPILVEAIKEQQDMIDAIKSNINDFGSVNVAANEVWVNFAPSFTNALDETQLPVVTVTSNKPGVSMYVAEKTSKGFKLVVQSGASQGLSVDYVAMAHGKKAAPAHNANKTDWNALSNTLPVPESATRMVTAADLSSAPDNGAKAAAGMKAKFGVQPEIKESAPAPEPARNPK